jgi:hypothetical protein
MHKLAAILATLALATSASAAPRKHPSKSQAARERFVLACVDERTGPAKDGGLELDEAEKLCRGIVRHQAKITKLATLAAKARAAGITRLAVRVQLKCTEEVSIACEDTTERDHDGGECSDATLEAKHAFDVCRGASPVAVKGGK